MRYSFDVVLRILLCKSWFGVNPTKQRVGAIVQNGFIITSYGRNIGFVVGRSDLFICGPWTLPVFTLMKRVVWNTTRFISVKCFEYMTALVVKTTFRCRAWF